MTTFPQTHEQPKSIPGCLLHPIYYATPIRRYGKTEWRCVVYEDRMYGRCTEYIWRRHGETWSLQSEWPTYNGNDSYGGLPKSLRKLYFEFRTEIQAALPLIEEPKP